MKYLIRAGSFRHFQVLLTREHPTHPVPDAPEGGVLLTAREQFTPTVFPSYQAAQEAIRRTIAWACNSDPQLMTLMVESSYEIISEEQLAAESSMSRRHTRNVPG